MSVWDRIGDAFDRTKNDVVKGAKISASWISGHTVEPAKDAYNNLHSWVGNNIMPSIYGTAGAVGGALDAVQYNAISRPVSTAATLVREGSLIHPSEWDDAWDKSSWLTAGESIAATAPFDPFRQQFVPDNVADSPQTRDAWFRGDSAAGRLQSGAIDFALGAFADPFVAVGKAAKTASVAGRSVKTADEAGDVLKVAAGAAEGTRKQTKLATHINRVIAETDGKTAAEIATLPEFANSADATALGYIFARANETLVDDATKRADVKRAAWGAMLGDRDSIKKITELHEGIADEIRRLGESPARVQIKELPPGANRTFVAGKEGVSVTDAPEVTILGPKGTTLVRDGKAETVGEDVSGLLPDRPLLDDGTDAARLELETQLDHLNRLIAIKGTVSVVKPSAREAGNAATRMARMNQTVIQNGAAGQRIRLISGLADNRLPGTIDVKNGAEGFTQLQEHLSQVRTMDATMRRQLLDQFIAAPNQGARQNVVRQAENAMIASIAQAHGLDAKATRKLIETGEGIRASQIGILQGRLYSAAPTDKVIQHVDDETGETFAWSRPLLQAQIENSMHMVDPRMLDKALKKANSNKVWANRLNKLGADDGDAIVGELTNLQDAADAMLRDVTGLWKFGALFRLAYPARVQVDSQMRLMAHLGAAQWALGFGKGFGSLWKYGFTAADGEIHGAMKLRNIVKEGDYIAAGEKMLKNAGVPDEYIRPVIASVAQRDGTMADVASELADRGLAKARMEGDWSIVAPDNANWAPAYQRAVNKQIRNSPLAMMVVNGATDQEIKAAIRKTGVARTEWRNLSASHADDLDQYLADLRGHVEHLLPAQEMRDVVSRKAVGQREMKRWFEDTTEKTPGVTEAGPSLIPRMNVHGESYSPTKVKPYTAFYNNLRNTWFHIAGDLPENTMARLPLYANSFKRNLTETVAKLGDDMSAEDLNNARIAADRMARREVGQVLFDASHTSNMAHAMPLFSPFFSAWEDMMKKWGGLLYDSPWVLSRLENAWDAPNNGNLVQDSNGNRVDANGDHWLQEPDGTWRKLTKEQDGALIGDGEYVILPEKLAGKVGAKGFRINKNSFNIVFQGDPWWLPGMGPLVQVPVNELVKSSFPEAADNPVIKYLLPYGASDESVISQLLPGWARQLRNSGVLPFMDNNQDYYNTYAQLQAQELSLFQAGKRDKEPTSEEVAGMTRNWYLLRAAISYASPVSMTPSPKTQFYMDQAHIYQQKYGREWQDKFFEDYPEYYRMALSLSANETGIVATENAYNVMKDSRIKKAIAADPELGWAFVGPDNVYGTDDGDSFNQSVYTYQLTQSVGEGNPTKYRGKQSPQDALNAVEAARGWSEYQKGSTWVNQQLADRGLTSINQKGAEDLKEAKKTFVEALKEQNKAFRDDYAQRDSGKAQRLVTALLTEQNKNPQFAARSDQQALRQYMDGREWIMGQLAGRKKHSLASNPDLLQAWDQFTSALVQGNIGFEQLWNRALEADSQSLTGELDYAN